MNYTEAESYLFGRRRMGMKYGLDRVRALLSAAGDPQRSFRTVHIVGTNGKGTTTAVLSEILMHLGLRTGRITSPHLLHYRERTAVDNVWITEDAVIEFLGEFRRTIEQLGATFFEITTAMSAWYFCRVGVEVVAAEAGLGGRLDATRLLEGECTIFTGVELEHRRILGSTEAAITAEKVAIAEDGTLLVAYRQSPKVEAVISQAVLSASLERLVPEPPEKAPLPGEQQRRNAGLALAAALRFSGRQEGEVMEAYERACSSLRWAGRLDRREGDPPILFDVAHNPGSISCLVEHLRKTGASLPVPGVVGFLEDKPWREMVRQLKGILSPVVATLPLDDRSLPPELLAEEFLTAGTEALWRAEIGDAVALARSLSPDLMVVTGSFFVVGEAMLHSWRQGWIELPESGSEQAQARISG